MKFITFRRHYLDEFMKSLDFSGDVLDVGGKKENKRGDFVPPVEKTKSWQYLNLDADTSPDFLCSADNIPTADESFDFVVMTEVLEHLENPESTLKEICRVLKTGGVLVATIPFLYQIHARQFKLHVGNCFF